MLGAYGKHLEEHVSVARSLCTRELVYTRDPIFRCSYRIDVKTANSVADVKTFLHEAPVYVG